MSKPKSAEQYDKMKSGTEWPGDPKPVSRSAMKARKRAIREGRLVAPPRDECPPEKGGPAPFPGTTEEQEAEGVAHKLANPPRPPREADDGEPAPSED